MLASITEYTRNFFDILLNNVWLRALAVLAATALVSGVANFFMTRTLKHLTTRTKTDLDDVLIGTVRLPLRFTIYGFGLYTVMMMLARNYYFDSTEGTSNVPEVFSLILFGVFVTIFIVIWTNSIIRFSGFLIETLSEMDGKFPIVQPRTIPLFQMLLKILFVALAGYLILSVWKQDVSGWVTSAGVLGLAVGFAARDTLANFFSGIFIIADAPYKLGDYIVLGNGERGRVTSIGIRSTRLLTRDDVEIIIPNAIIGNTEIINQSGGPYEKFRVRIKVGVAYGSDVDQVRTILEEIATSETSVMEEPSPRVRFRAFGASSLDFELLGWVEEPGARGKVTDILLTTIYKRFAAENIEIPYPKRDVYLHQVTEDKPEN